MTRRSLWWLRFTLLAVLLVVIGGAVTSWIVVRVWGPEFTRERIEAALADGLGQPVRVGAVHLRPWRARLSLSDVVSIGPPDGITLRIPAVDVDVAIESLWRRHLVLSIRLHDVDLSASTSADSSRGTVPFPLPEFVAVGPLRVGVGSVRVFHGRVLVREPGRQLGLELRSADVYARPVAGDLDVSLQGAGLRIEHAGRAADLDTVGLDARLSAETMKLRRLAWRWRGESMRIGGTVQAPWSDAPELAVRLTGAVPLEPLASMLGSRDAVSGVARVTANVSGALASPRVEGRVSVPELA